MDFVEKGIEIFKICWKLYFVYYFLWKKIILRILEVVILKKKKEFLINIGNFNLFYLNMIVGSK